MKQYVIDELRPRDYEKIRESLDEKFGPPEIGGIYWVPLESAILSPVQKAHETCQPFCFALELEQSQLICELLVRTREKVRCDCIQYATVEQRNWIIGVIDNLFSEISIIT